MGLAKFRETLAEFKQFHVAKQLPTGPVDGVDRARVSNDIEELRPSDSPKPQLIDKLAKEGAAPAVLLDRLGCSMNRRRRCVNWPRPSRNAPCRKPWIDALQGNEDKIDLLQAASVIARLDNDEVDVDAYRAEVERMAGNIKASLPKDADEAAKLKALNKYLFTERGFHGSRGDYYDRANSHHVRSPRRPRRSADHAFGAVHGVGPATRLKDGRRGNAGAFHRPLRPSQGRRQVD